MVGRRTGSTHRGYLVWKIREARKGNIPVGPSQRPPKRDPGTKMMVLPLRMAEPDVEVLDAAWKRLGFKSRMAFLRHAMASALHAGGDIDAAIALRG
ncbi:MAG: hypothetical protein H6732_20385 [Alphaproteobacteria bacterium]|nr:hypothetical protein [Alphaproteobacteria bacterium]